MIEKHIATLRAFAAEDRESAAPEPRKTVMKALEAFGRERLSEHFFMRDFLHSEISAVHGIPNIPSDPELALRAGSGLCQNLLEPLHEHFGQVVVRSAYRSPAVNRFGNDHGLSCASNDFNRAKHIWDLRDKDGCMGATACIVIPWFIDTRRYRETRDWRPMAWFIHDHLPYSEMCFFTKNAAFNLNWREKDPRRDIRFYLGPPGGKYLTRPGLPNHSGDHSEAYPEFPAWKGR